MKNKIYELELVGWSRWMADFTVDFLESKTGRIVDDLITVIINRHRVYNYEKLEKIQVLSEDEITIDDVINEFNNIKMSFKSRRISRDRVQIIDENLKIKIQFVFKFRENGPWFDKTIEQEDIDEYFELEEKRKMIREKIKNKVGVSEGFAKEINDVIIGLTKAGVLYIKDNREVGDVR